MTTYKALNINANKIFIVNPDTEIENQGDSMNSTKNENYKSLSDRCDDIFPSILTLSDFGTTSSLTAVIE